MTHALAMPMRTGSSFKLDEPFHIGRPEIITLQLRGYTLTSMSKYNCLMNGDQGKLAAGRSGDTLESITYQDVNAGRRTEMSETGNKTKPSCQP